MALTSYSSNNKMFHLLALIACVLLCAAIRGVTAEEKGDKIIILPNKHEYGHKESYIPYPMYIPYGHGGGGYGGGFSHSMGYGGGFGGGYGGFGGGMGDMMHGY